MSNHDHKLLRQYFDSAWYLQTYPDVNEYPDGPYEHYIRHGISERRSPHPLFDIMWYVEQFPELEKIDTDPLTYYFSKGWRKLQSPHPLFDHVKYLSENTDLIAADVDPLRHYLERGWREGRCLHPLFDTTWYLETNPDVAASDQDPLSHFLVYGWREGRQPHPLFDISWYLENYRDIASGDFNPWLHYVLFGWKEGRWPNSKFNTGWYLASYLDGAPYDVEPLAHYLAEGWKEGLLPSPDYSAAAGFAGRSAPLLEDVVVQLRESKAPVLELAEQSRRGTIIFVTHEVEVGGAPHVLKLFAQWVRDRTRFDVRIISLGDGNLRRSFEQVAPLLVLSDHSEEDKSDIIGEWIGEEVRGIFLNSAASGGLLKYMRGSVPTVAFIHEMPRVLDLFPEAVEWIRRSAVRVIGGGPDVTDALRRQYGFPAEVLATASSFIEPLPSGTDFNARRTAARHALEVPVNRLVVMGCGILHWRKSPMRFIDVAEQVINAGIDAEFIWLGGGPDYEACKEAVAEKRLEERVRFTGYEPDAPARLAAGDIFLLPSEEDPFPLVALYAAQAGMPIICFREAGGIEGFVSRGGGVAVQHLDVKAMADAVVNYARQPERRAREGLAGRRQVERSHTIDVAGPALLHHLREAMAVPPEVSVIVPNYNCQSYLAERLGSIEKQRFQDFEVILLDDASSDNSVEILRDFAERRPGTELIVNDENTGSPFVQWLRGIGLARSQLVWLAEADDRCEAEFLQTLLPWFDDPNVRLAYSGSRPVTDEGVTIGDYRHMYLDRISPGRWDGDYIATDHEEANKGLGIANSIPNASAVLFRKFAPEPEFVRELQAMRLCGDWYFYVRAMRGGFVAYSSALLNDHRRHANTVTHKLEGSARYFSELAIVRGLLGRTYRQTTAARARIEDFLAQDLERFSDVGPSTLPELPKPAKALPTVLVVAPDLSPGGGQVFAISLAAEWVRRGGRVVLYNVGNQPSHPAMQAKIPQEVTLLESGSNGLSFGELIQRFDIDVVHSSIWWADRWVDDNREHLPANMPWIITMHGCHETILGDLRIDPEFGARISRMIQRASWVYTAQKNLQVFEAYNQPASLQRIPNGMSEEPVRVSLTRSALGLRENAIVFCLASRAISSKGWHEAVELTEQLNHDGFAVDLLLIGEGPSAERVRRESPEHVTVVGQVANLQDYLEVADIGLLPSYFVGESLPLVLIEMMAKGLPVIASEVGEIPQMICGGNRPAGILIPLKAGGVDTDALHAAAKKLLDPSLRQRFSQAARRRFAGEFTLKMMVDRYEKVYRAELRNHDRGAGDEVSSDGWTVAM